MMVFLEKKLKYMKSINTRSIIIFFTNNDNDKVRLIFTMINLQVRFRHIKLDLLEKFGKSLKVNTFIKIC